MPAQDRRCRTCSHYGLPEGVRPNKNKVWPCRWVMPETYVFPEALTRGHDNPVARLQRPEKGWMGPNDGQACPTWEERRPNV